MSVNIDINQLFNTMVQLMFTFVVLVLVFSIFSGISKSIEKAIR